MVRPEARSDQDAVMDAANRGCVALPLRIILLLSSLSFPQDSLEPLVKQIAQELSLPTTAAETALTVLTGHRVRTRRQLGLLAAHAPLWATLPIVPPALKQALLVASYGAGATASPKSSRWRWLVLPLIIGGVGLVVWRNPRALAFVKRIRIE